MVMSLFPLAVLEKKPGFLILLVTMLGMTFSKVNQTYDTEKISVTHISNLYLGNNTALSICPGPTMVSGCIACVHHVRRHREIMVGDSVDVDFTFNCKAISFRASLFGAALVDFSNIQCQESDGGMTTVPPMSRDLDLP